MLLRRLPALLLALACCSHAAAYEEAFPPTAVGVSEVKTLPAGTLLKSSAKGRYFDENGRLFQPLFRYISSRNIAMTVPVEAQIDSAAMYFWVGRAEGAKVNGSAEGVEVIKIPARTVASLGARGGYSQGNFEETRDALLRWVASQKQLEVTGKPYAVYWNGPFTPWFAKRFEVHVPVRTRTR